VNEILQAVGRASKRSSAVVREEMRAGVYSVATIASLAPLVGLFGTVLGIGNSFRGLGTSQTTAMAYLCKNLSESLWPTAFGLLVGLVSLWFYKYLAARLCTFDLEMENASLELLNQLSRLPGRFAITPGVNSRMFGEEPLDKVRRDEKFLRRCTFLAGTALVLAWFAQALLYFGHDALPMSSAVLTASVFVPIAFGIACFPAYPVWVKLLRRRPGGLVALASIFCLCWSAAELALGWHLP
jgi:hypothetical protein